MSEFNMGVSVLSPPGGFGSNSPTGSGINSPGLTPGSTKPKRRSISDINHIFQLFSELQQTRRSQNEKNGRIQAKLNSERPYSDEELKTEGLEYKSNISTKPLSTTVGKVASRLTKAVQAARYLTSASLPDSVPDAKKKTELFRAKTTDLIRKWPGWYNFCNEVATEDSTFGWAVVAWLDESTWKPELFRQDKTFLPDGTKQTVDSTQVIIFQKYILPHELANMIEDREAAEAAGWDIDSTVDAINRARPPAISGAQAAPYTDFRRYEDAIRESTVSVSLQNGAKQVNIVHCFAVEIDGKVSHYIGDADAKKLLFEKEDRFPNVQDCLAFMSYEQAPTLMGSKGIGREVYELAGALDRARNEVIDRLQLSGKIIVQGPENMLSRFKLSVVGNVILIPEGFTITQNKIEASVKEFIELDLQLTQLLDQIAGGVTPRPARDAERVTAKEIEVLAAREEEKRDDVTTRFIVQVSEIISCMQRRIWSKDCDDENVRFERAALLRVLSEAELDYLRVQPALRTIEDYTMSEAQRIVLIAQESRNDPLYDHRKMEHKKISALVNSEFADDVLLGENDPTVEAEQSRMQQLEDLALAGGRPVPVSPRDNHLVHLAVWRQDFAAVAQAAGGGKLGALQSAQIWLQHAEDHLNFAQQTGVDKEQLKPFVEEITQVAKQIGELQAAAQQQAETMQAQIATPAAPLAAAPSPALAPAPVAPAA